MTDAAIATATRDQEEDAVADRGSARATVSERGGERT
jgi:hypothetical protein